MFDIDKIVNSLPEKGEDPITTSRKFKSDLAGFFLYDIKDYFPAIHPKTCVEISGGNGTTTYLLSYIFDQVVYVEAPSFVNNPNHFNNICNNAMKRLGSRNNILYLALDAYKQPWPFRNVDVFFIDCSHFYKEVVQDIDNAFLCMKSEGFIIFDDWNLPEDNFAVKRAIQDRKLDVVKFVGNKITFNPNNHFDFKFGEGEPEGVIVKV